MRILLDQQYGSSHTTYFGVLNDRVCPRSTSQEAEPIAVTSLPVDMDADIAPENPFPAGVQTVTPPEATDTKTRIPYYEEPDRMALGITHRHQEVLRAAANGCLKGCGVTKAGITLYPEMLKDVSKVYAKSALERARVAQSSVWFVMVF